MSLRNNSRFTLGRRKGVRLFADGPGGSGGIAYLLNDMFTTALAAGAVNGTAAEPGPGTRTVVDGNNVLSIVGGVASFATGGVAEGNPGLWYPTQARVFGKVLFGRIITTAQAGNGPLLGWDTNQSAALVDGFRFVPGNSLRVRENGSNIVTNLTYTDSVAYDIAMVMQASGMYWFIKGGVEFLAWTLAWYGAMGIADGFPAALAGSTASAFTADNIRVPVSTYTVPYLAYDTFTRANGALGSTEAVGPNGQAGTARAWTLQAGTIVVASNAASLTILSGALNAIATVSAVSADVIVDVAVTRTLGSGGSVIRYTDANNYLRASHDGTNALLEQVVAGTPSTLRTGAATYSAGAILRVIVIGTTGYLFYNGTAVGAAFTVPASASTLHGLYGIDLSCTWDNFQVMAYQGYAGLDAL